MALELTQYATNKYNPLREGFTNNVMSFAPTAQVLYQTDDFTFTINNHQDLLVMNKDTPSFITLPLALGSGKIKIIANIGAGDCVVSGKLTNTINGESSKILAQYEGMQVKDFKLGEWVII